MNVAELTTRYLEHAVSGKHADHGSVGNWWYRGAVMFYAATPSWRAVHAAKGTGKKAVILVKHSSWKWEANARHKKLQENVQVISVPDIAVFSVYDTDLLADGQLLNDRMRFIMLSRMAALIEDEVNALTGEKAREKRAQLTKKLDKYYADYAEYRKFVAPSWPEAPKLYKRNLEDTLKAKIDAFEDPKAVEKRTRDAAKRVALKALGVDTKPKAA